MSRELPVAPDPYSLLQLLPGNFVLHPLLMPASA